MLIHCLLPFSLQIKIWLILLMNYVIKEEKIIFFTSCSSILNQSCYWLLSACWLTDFCPLSFLSDLIDAHVVVCYWSCVANLDLSNPHCSNCCLTICVVQSHVYITLSHSLFIWEEERVFSLRQTSVLIIPSR